MWAEGVARGGAERPPALVLYWTPEMRGAEHMTRLTGRHAAINYERLTEGGYEDYELPKIKQAAAELLDRVAPRIVFEEAATLTLARLRSRIRAEQRRGGLGLVVVDPVGYLKVEGRDEVERNSAKAEGLKELAGELDVPILATHHLRKWSGQGDPRPTDQDIRDSGRWNDFMHLVLLLHRESYYAEVEDKPTDPLKLPQWEARRDSRTMEVIQTKKRGGKRGTLTLGCNVATGAFWDLETRILGAVA
jgi:replicative DNA helicase